MKLRILSIALLNEVWIHNGVKLKRIKALRTFGNVQAGELGGWLESSDNLAHEGTCWVFNDAKVYGHAKLVGDQELTTLN